jgi:imidazole glycerol phosphate synthase glutamine amidotransferase subunit
VSASPDPSPITIVRTGAANIASVVAAMERLQRTCIVTDDPRTVDDAALLVLPGVGTLAAAMTFLNARGLTGVLRDRIAAARPVLAICLGMQILLEGSEESPGVAGLGVAPGVATRFTNTVGESQLRIPQMGWNRVGVSDGNGILTSGTTYFANSYRLEAPPPAATGWRSAFTGYGGTFVSAIERGTIVACQFHPELSGRFGAQLISRWLEHAAAAIGSVPQGASR